MSIIILSSKDDKSTQDVVRWLKFWKKKVIRINSIDDITSISVTLKNNLLKINLVINEIIELNLSDIESYWYRRGDFNYRILSDIIKNKTRIEFKVLRDFVWVAQNMDF